MSLVWFLIDDKTWASEPATLDDACRFARETSCGDEDGYGVWLVPREHGNGHHFVVGTANEAAQFSEPATA